MRLLLDVQPPPAALPLVIEMRKNLYTSPSVLCALLLTLTNTCLTFRSPYTLPLAPPALRLCQLHVAGPTRRFERSLQGAECCPSVFQLSAQSLTAYAVQVACSVDDGQVPQQQQQRRQKRHPTPCSSFYLTLCSVSYGSVCMPFAVVAATRPASLLPCAATSHFCINPSPCRQLEATAAAKVPPMPPPAERMFLPQSRLEKSLH